LITLKIFGATFGSGGAIAPPGYAPAAKDKFIGVQYITF